MMLRRDFLRTAGGLAFAGSGFSVAPELTSKERVDRAMAGQDVDRPPFSFWHHFGLTSYEAHARRTLEFHSAYRTDLVKVMSDFPYPKSAGKWYELKFDDNPFPDQIRALELIRKGLNGSAYMIETVFNPWNVAQKLSSKEEVLRLKEEKPQALLDALDVITESEIAHAKRAYAWGASGVLFSVANALSAEMSVEDYQKFSAPFDKRFLDGVANAAPLNILHLHVEPPYLATFHNFHAPIINYSMHVSKIPIIDVRRQFRSWVIAGGIDEVNYRNLTPTDLARQWYAAATAAGPKFILTPGCSVPNDSTREELARLPDLLETRPVLHREVSPHSL
jgi:uroporphyrinogen decarboxylase